MEITFLLSKAFGVLVGWEGGEKVMLEVMKTSIVKAINFVKRFIKPNEKAPTINVNITIHSGDNNKVSVSLSSKE